jgi:hypothetical protein
MGYKGTEIDEDLFIWQALYTNGWIFWLIWQESLTRNWQHCNAHILNTGTMIITFWGNFWCTLSERFCTNFVLFCKTTSIYLFWYQGPTDKIWNSQSQSYNNIKMTSHIHITVSIFQFCLPHCIGQQIFGATEIVQGEANSWHNCITHMLYST